MIDNKKLEEIMKDYFSMRDSGLTMNKMENFYAKIERERERSRIFRRNTKMHFYLRTN